MSILDKLKSWYTLEEAAARLTRTIGQEISERDLIQLAAEGHLMVSWYLKGAHGAAQVAVFCPFPRIEENLLQTEALKGPDGLTWLSYLNGPFKLPVDVYPSWGDWLLTFIGKGGESAMLWDPIIIDPDDGSYWAFFVANTTSDFHHFPTKEEITVGREDIEAFEQRHSKKLAIGASVGELAEAEREKLLKHVAGLAMLLAEKNNRYTRGKNINASTLAEDVTSLIDSLPDSNAYGAGLSSIRASISEGIKLLKK